MSTNSKFLLLLVALSLGVFLVVHGDRALHASLPRDMPADSRFIASGYDLSHNEQKGQWIACRDNAASNNDFCRVTDSRGTVVYQGEFQAIDHSVSVPNDELKVAKETSRLWVNGPAERGPVPVIPLANGRVLVPSQDRDALIDRWNQNPAELREIAGL